jgi:hypothetical protein
VIVVSRLEESAIVDESEDDGRCHSIGVKFCPEKIERGVNPEKTRSWKVKVKASEAV